MIDPRGFAKEFRDFLLKSNMFAMAMGVVIGTAVSKVVASLVGDIVMPVVGILTPVGNWRAFSIGYKRLNFTIGNVMGTILDFVIIAAVVFIVTKAFVKSTPPPPTKTCPECLEGIHPDAKRCKFCTAQVPPPSPATPVS